MQIKQYLYIGIACVILFQDIYIWRTAVNATNHKRDLKDATAQIAYNEAIRYKQVQYDELRTKKAEELAIKKTNAEVITKIIYKDRIKYVEKHPDIIVNVPVYWVQYINSAISGKELSDTSSTRQFIDTPSTVGIDRIADIMVTNITMCNGYIMQIEAWQTWYKDMQKVNKL
jgi:hypothetical protein